MFKNIGKKIKKFAIAICVINILLSVFVALIVCNNIEEEFAVVLLIFFGIVAFGFLLAWFSAIFIYAFGQLVDNSDIICAILRSTIDNQNADIDNSSYKDYFQNGVLSNKADTEDDSASTSDIPLYIPKDL